MSSKAATTESSNGTGDATTTGRESPNGTRERAQDRTERNAGTKLGGKNSSEKVIWSKNITTEIGSEEDSMREEKNDEEDKGQKEFSHIGLGHSEGQNSPETDVGETEI